MPKYTIEKILAMNIRSLKTSELVSIANQASSYARERKSSALKALRSKENKDLPTPQAYRKSREYIDKEGKVQHTKVWRYAKFTVPKETKNKTIYRDKLLKSISKARRFLEDKSSTVEGWKSILKDFSNRLSAMGVYHSNLLSKSNYNDFWEIYNTLAETYDPQIASNYDSNQLQELIAKEMIKQEISKDRVLEILNEKLGSRYKSSVEELETDDDIVGLNIGSNK